MKTKAFSIFLFLICAFTTASAQTPSSTYRPVDPMGALSADVNQISTSVKKLTETLKAFVDKWEKVSGLTLTEKQQKLVLGMELLTRTEIRVTNFQKAQIELTEKLNASRSRLSQVETDLRPRNLNNSTAFEGTTETQELRDSRQSKLQSERTSLMALLTSIQGNLAETNDNLKDAEALADRLRRMFLPQVERELYEQ